MPNIIEKLEIKLSKYDEKESNLKVIIDEQD